MFTGLIEKCSKVISISGNSMEKKLVIENPFNVGEIKKGESVAVDGTCLTVTSFDAHKIEFFVSARSVKATIAASYKTGITVNLERAMQFGGRLDGHIVQGHVDTTAKMVAMKKVDSGYEIEITLDSDYENLVVDKGSVAVNGISLTVAELKPSSFIVSVIPETLSSTNISEKLHNNVNIEFDILGKYVQRQLSLKSSKNIDSMLEML